MKTRRVLMSLIALGLLAALTGSSPGMQLDRSLEIVVRDVAGAPLVGVKVWLYPPGESQLFWEEAVTDEDGVAHFGVEPGEYVIAFEDEYDGRRFISEALQNAGAASNGLSGGFPVYLDPAATNYTMYFVVVMNTERDLVPLYDLSESVASAPIPFTYDGNIGDEVALQLEPENSELIFEPLVQPTAAVEQVSQADAQPDPLFTQMMDSVASTVALALALTLSAAVVIWMWVQIIIQARGGRAEE